MGKYHLKSFVVFFIIIVVLGITGGVYFKYVVPFLVGREKTALSISDSLATYNNNFELELVKADLDTYGTISPKVEEIILSNIEDVSKKYKIPIGLLHCIFRVESEYRFNIDHPTVTVQVHGKSVVTHAIGLGGVMWCYWKDSLRVHGIAQMESDLYLPDVNIQASGYILSVDIRQVLSDKANVNDVLDEIIRRYYGAYNDIYMAKMTKITSDLWMKRMSKAILDHKLKK